MIKNEQEIDYVYSIYKSWREAKEQDNFLLNPLDETFSELVFLGYEKGKEEPFISGKEIKLLWKFQKQNDDLKEKINLLLSCKTLEELKAQKAKLAKCFSCKHKEKTGEDCSTCKDKSNWEM